MGWIECIDSVDQSGLDLMALGGVEFGWVGFLCMRMIGWNDWIRCNGRIGFGCIEIND